MSESKTCSACKHFVTRCGELGWCDIVPWVRMVSPDHSCEEWTGKVSFPEKLRCDRCLFWTRSNSPEFQPIKRLVNRYGYCRGGAALVERRAIATEESFGCKGWKNAKAK